MPAYNPGPILGSTVRNVLSVWSDLWVVVDGSTDGSEKEIEALQSTHPSLRVLVCRENRGKGSAILHGARAALEAGYTHALLMDCDGQHDPESIGAFIETSRRNPESMVLGQPVFGPEVPRERLWGRKVTVGLARVEVLGPWLGDTLFGFRVFPLEPLMEVMPKENQGRRYDFDHEAAVRLFWAGTPGIKLDAPCYYLSSENGGVSHFHYIRDNIRFFGLHLRLIKDWVRQVPELLKRRAQLRESP
jgi:glycosyltransferase involved in cell wall biosynthesis